MNSNIKLIYSEKHNQFYTPMRIDNDVGIVCMIPTKNRHDKGITKKEVARIEECTDMRFIVMHDPTITSEDYFMKIMSNDCNVNLKLHELRWFKRNMLSDSEIAMKKLNEIAFQECDKSMVNVHNEALGLYSSLNHRQIITDSRSTYIGQDVPKDIQILALKKRLFIQRSDDFCGKKKNRHPSSKTDRLCIQAKYPCGFIVRDRGGTVIGGDRFLFSLQDAIDFVKNHIPTEDENRYTNLYLVPMSLRKKRQLGICYNILKNHELYYKNEHNYFFWVLDKQGNVIAGGKNGFGFKWLLGYCRKLKNKPIKRENK